MASDQRQRRQVVDEREECLCQAIGGVRPVQREKRGLLDETCKKCILSANTPARGRVGIQ
jgi:hypothetical protein